MEQLPECDFCERTDSIRIIGDTKVCPEHLSELNRERINANDVIRQSRDVDNRVNVRTEIFNAETVAIIDLEKAIDGDESITNKPYAKAVVLLERFKKFKQVIFDANETIITATNNQKALQTRLNTLANTLRDDERERLHIADLNYKPRHVKMPINAKTIKISKKNLDNVALKRYAAELNIPEFTLRAVAIQKNLTTDAVYKLMKENIEAAKAKSTNSTNSTNETK